DARVVRIMCDHPLHISLETVMLIHILQSWNSRRLDPARIMDALARLRLEAQCGLGVPAGIEQNKHHTDAVAVGDPQKSIDAIEKSLGVFDPQEVVKIDADGIHAN